MTVAVAGRSWVAAGVPLRVAAGVPPRVASCEFRGRVSATVVPAAGASPTCGAGRG
jgi:hypothetical protein